MTVPSATTTLLPRADGSSESTSPSGVRVIASVTGPMEVRPRDELPDKAFVEVLVRPSAGVASTRERNLESHILSCVSPLIHRAHHPRTMIQINVQIVEEGKGNGLLAAGLNAVALALVDAGVPVKDIVVATEVEEGEARCTVAFDRRGRCVFLLSQGVVDEGGLARAVERGRRECGPGEDLEMDSEMGAEGGRKRVGRLMRETIETKVGADMRWME